MAYLINDKDEEQLKQGAQGSGGGAFAGETAQNPQGTGGDQKWVNIQEYLGANPNAGAGSSLLENDAGKQLHDEAGRFQNEVSGYENKDRSQGVSSFNLGFDPDQYYKNTKDYYLNSLAGFGPSDDGQRNSFKSQYESRLSDAKNLSQRSDLVPDIGQFNYNPSAQAVGVKEKLNNQGVNSPFESYMSSLYNKAYQPLTPGERDLQNQFDVGDTKLESTRSKLANDVVSLFSGSQNKAGELNQKREQGLSSARNTVDKLKSGLNRFQEDTDIFNREFNDKKYSGLGTDVFYDNRRFSLADLGRNYEDALKLGGGPQNEFLGNNLKNLANVLKTNYLNSFKK